MTKVNINMLFKTLMDHGITVGVQVMTPLRFSHPLTLFINVEGDIDLGVGGES